MIDDPIVAQVRRAGKALAEEASYDVHQFFVNLRRSQEPYTDRLVQSLDQTVRSLHTDVESLPTS